jgi:hypothetical protein
MYFDLAPPMHAHSSFGEWRRAWADFACRAACLSPYAGYLIRKPTDDKSVGRANTYPTTENGGIGSFPAVPARQRRGRSTSRSATPSPRTRASRPGDPPPVGQMAKCGTCSVDAFRTGARRPTYRRSCGLGRVIPCSDPAKQRHNIIGNRVALVGEESVSGVTAEPPPGQSGAPNHARLYHWQ